MLSICMGVVEMPTDCNILIGTPPLAQKKRSIIMTTSKKYTLEVVGSNRAIMFLN